MNKGFSLVELIVVIAIMAILVGVAVPVYTQYIAKATDGVDAQLVEEIDRAIETAMVEVKANKDMTALAEATSGTKIVIEVTKNKYDIKDADPTTTADFLNALKAIVPESKLVFKGSAEKYANGAKFTLDLDTLTADYTPLNPATSGTSSAPAVSE